MSLMPKDLKDLLIVQLPVDITNDYKHEMFKLLEEFGFTSVHKYSLVTRYCLGIIHTNNLYKIKQYYDLINEELTLHVHPLLNMKLVEEIILTQTLGISLSDLAITDAREVTKESFTDNFYKDTRKYSYTIAPLKACITYYRVER